MKRNGRDKHPGVELSIILRPRVPAGLLLLPNCPMPRDLHVLRLASQ